MPLRSLPFRRLSTFSVLAALSLVACAGGGNAGSPTSRGPRSGAAGASAANGGAPASPVIGATPGGGTPVITPSKPGSVVMAPPLAPQGERTLKVMNECDGKVDATQLATFRRTDLPQSSAKL